MYVSKTYRLAAEFVVEGYHGAVLVKHYRIEESVNQPALLLYGFDFVFANLCEPEFNLFFRKNRLFYFFIGDFRFSRRISALLSADILP